MPYYSLPSLPCLHDSRICLCPWSVELSWSLRCVKHFKNLSKFSLTTTLDLNWNNTWGYAQPRFPYFSVAKSHGEFDAGENELTWNIENLNAYRYPPHVTEGTSNLYLRVCQKLVQSLAEGRGRRGLLVKLLRQNPRLLTRLIPRSCSFVRCQNRKKHKLGVMHEGMQKKPWNMCWTCLSACPPCWTSSNQWENSVTWKRLTPRKRTGDAGSVQTMTTARGLFLRRVEFQKIMSH